jgi:hypothetical protein
MKSWTRILSPIYWLEILLKSIVAAFTAIFQRP